ncbi:alpha-amylase family glycosyl hydrolase [Kribbella sp. NPDC006257]|uniref:alpha-amylase family glycosyl hydrolase n=1 Tax=Kribbella sp. NPDC006257 TaxID=3156738 RepID=UPI0033A5A2BD
MAQEQLLIGLRTLAASSAAAAVDPRFGTLGDLVEFMEVAQERGLRLLLDLPFNHTSNQHLHVEAIEDRVLPPQLSRYRIHSAETSALSIMTGQQTPSGKVASSTWHGSSRPGGSPVPRSPLTNAPILW